MKTTHNTLGIVFLQVKNKIYALNGKKGLDCTWAKERTDWLRNQDKMR